MWTPKSERLVTSASRRREPSSQTRTSIMPGSDGYSGWFTAAAAAGKNGALLAQPFRDRLHEGAGRHWRRAGRNPVDGGQTFGRPGAAVGTDRAVPQFRAGQFQRSARGSLERSRHGNLARRTHEYEEPAAGKFWTRGHGTVHDGRGVLHGTRRVRG